MSAWVMAEKLHSVDEIAVMLGVHPNTVYKLIANGDLPASKVRRQYRIRESDFNAYLDRTQRKRTDKGEST